MRLIDADELDKVKFHELPYTNIVPADLLKHQTEAYERGWNDAIDAIIESADTINAVPVRHGKWIDKSCGIEGAWNHCSVCGERAIDLYDYCPNCGAKMEEDDG